MFSYLEFWHCSPDWVSAWVFAPDGASKITGMAVATFGVVYVALLLNLLQLIRYHGDAGHWWLLYFIVVTNRHRRLLRGSLIGRTKMIPKVSPGKTWEGFAGGIVFSVLASWAFLHLPGNILRVTLVTRSCWR